ncbi:glutamine-synthetase adenylyltransferase [Szabonella alba]|uniref:Glutamine-synthetase adenylyltransferase n=1 Tax=Szabonella alba TaxID=2804194 RepID=A0A8K0Y2K0_9RHOB|nr:glutamine-synthetase adenylyltransferase [Szabonella alba]MBL4917899.1 glutamine-synthetase adenylyltransferase [Szabonella alba]
MTSHLPFTRRLSRCPVPHDADAAEDAAARFSGLSKGLRDLLAGTAGGSPFLADLMQREEGWLRAAFALSPETALETELFRLRDLPAEGLGAELRRAKRRVALLAALADLGGVWPLETVTSALTRLADGALSVALRHLVADEIRRGKIPGATPEDAATAAGMVIFAMGKMGAGELNYSSDIDLICLFDETRYPGSDAQEARAAFIRVTRKLCALIADRTDEGYVFRTDLRLRPDAAVTPVCLSMAAAENYYESVGRTWERAAWIKARPCAGDVAAGERFLRTLSPFVWRKHLDFVAIQDAHDMRLRIRDHRGLHGPVQIEGHNIKLGVGGIREIEFFVQTRQLIAGGRDPSLRDRTTLGGLAALARKGWLPEATARELATLYRAHREVEHRLQMVHDAQTQEMPATPKGVARIAHLDGAADVATWRAGLKARLERTDHLTEGFFAPAEAEEGPNLSETARKIVEGWKGYPALRSERAGAIFRRVRPGLLTRLQRAANPDEALIAFDGFLSGLPAGVQIFSLFEANPQLVDLIVDIAATSPALARYLSRNSAVLDAVIGGSFFSDWPGARGLAAELGAALSGIEDYERKLDAARRWMKEWHFRVGVHLLRGVIDAFEAGKQYADLAEAVLVALFPVVATEFAGRHGPPPGRGACLLGMGSLGAGRLNAGSDLDVIVIYDAGDAEASEGPRPLAVRPYYARFTQALVTAVTAPMAEGRLYELDMRLRPSGRQGPVATALASFRNYQLEEAWTWEHLALTRARVLAGDAELGAEVEAFRREVLAAKGQGDSVLTDVADMRRRLAEAKPARGSWEARNGPGRLMDVELLAQTCALRTGDPARRIEAQLRAGVRGAILSQTDEQTLLDAYRLCWRLQAGTRLLTEGTLEMAELGEGARAFLLRETGQGTGPSDPHADGQKAEGQKAEGQKADAAALSDRLETVTIAAAAVIARILPAKETGHDG